MRCKRVIAPISSGVVSAIRSIIWPPTIPAGPAACASAPPTSARTAASPCVSGATRAAPAPGLLLVLLVAVCPAAPEVAVVHRRQIVVDQRIGVGHFDRCRDLQG